MNIILDKNITLELQDTFQPSTYIASMLNMPIEIYELFCNADITLRNDSYTVFEDMTEISIYLVEIDGTIWKCYIMLDGDQLDNDCINESIESADITFKMQ